MMDTSSVVTRSKTTKTVHDTIYVEQWELPTGKLPVEKDILCCLLYLLRPDRAGKALRSQQEAVKLLTHALIEHWHFCNVYTIGERHIIKKMCSLYSEFQKNLQARRDRQNEKWKERMTVYNNRVKTTLFDISTADVHRLKRLENEYGVKMSEIEYDFLKDQQGPRVGYCTTFIDRKWEKTPQRQKKEQESYEKRKRKAALSSINKTISWDEVVSDSEQKQISSGAWRISILPKCDEFLKLVTQHIQCLKSFVTSGHPQKGFGQNFTVL
jgi:hypothetical protein